MASSPHPHHKGPASDAGTAITEPVSKAGSKRSHGSSTVSKGSWVVYGSPLWHRDRVPVGLTTLPPLRLKELESTFVNDALYTSTTSRSTRKPIIPSYDAVRDKYARHYFRSPVVNTMMQKNRGLASHKEQRALISSNKSLNKLSVRRRCRLSPNKDDVLARELDFVNDAILTERGRTKYKDIIPPYNATYDNHCKGYFKRPDIKRLVTLTCSPRSPRVS